MDVNANLVRELRDKTGAGVMDCKTALAETKGDLDQAVVWLREKGIGVVLRQRGSLQRGFAQARVVSDGYRRRNCGIFARFIIAGEPFSLANAQLTPTLKIRRHTIREAYETEFEALYDGKGMAA